MFYGERRSVSHESRKSASEMFSCQSCFLRILRKHFGSRGSPFMISLERCGGNIGFDIAGSVFCPMETVAFLSFLLHGSYIYGFETTLVLSAGFHSAECFGRLSVHRNRQMEHSSLGKDWGLDFEI